MKKVLTIGGATQDIFMHYNNAEGELVQTIDGRSYILLEEGIKIEVDKLTYASGGGATNSAAGLKKLGLEVTAVCKVGNDGAGAFVREDLDKRGIATEFMLTSEQGSTGVSFIMPTPSGNRVLFVHRGVNAELSEHDIPFKVFGEYSGLYVTSLAGRAAKLLPHIASQGRSNGLSIANNPGKSQLIGDTKALEKALKDIDIFMLNAHEARVFLTVLSNDTHCAQRLLKSATYHETPTCPDLLKQLVTLHDTCLNVRHFFKEILDRGPRTVVVTNGSEGVYAATQEKMYFHKALPTNVVNSVGAGDAFGSCFFGTLLAGRTIEEALSFGVITSSSVLSTPTAKEGTLTFNELEERQKQISKDYLQTFDW